MATTTTSISVATNADLDSFTLSDDKYLVMGVARTATAADIKQAFRRLALLYHPDRHSGSAQTRAEEIFKRISAANETLSNPALRAEYDQMLARGETSDLAAEARRQQIDPLDQILADILTYQHIFDDGLRHTPPLLRDSVYNSLITADVRKDKRAKRGTDGQEGRFEQIVGDMPLRDAPEGIAHFGMFTAGSVILTNLRVFFAFMSSQTDTKGNVQTTYTYSNLQAASFPSMRYVSIDCTDRVLNRFTVSIGTDQPIEFVPKISQLGKLLLLCSIWGVPVQPRESYSRRSEYKNWRLTFPAVGATIVAVLFVLAAFWKSINASSSAQEPGSGFMKAGVAATLTAGILVLTWGVIQLHRAYGRRGVVDLLQESSSA